MNHEFVLCFSHLRWNFVFQRPQHLLTRCAVTQNVIFFEEPVFEEISAPRLDLTADVSGVVVAVPKLPQGLTEIQKTAAQRRLLDEWIAFKKPAKVTLWYYTPMALPFTRHLNSELCVYDCMDELSGFDGAPAEIRQLETELLARADLVFTGGKSLFEKKRDLHPHVYFFPSSVDVKHFSRARLPLTAPADQAEIPHPRLGFFGVIDERFDIALIREMARLRPDWQMVIIGPVVKIDPATLPIANNIHYLGGKSYDALPDYLAAWDIALLPFALNKATQFISPTKTPEYLAAGCPVISTPIRDVVQSYGKQNLVSIAETAEQAVDAAEVLLHTADQSEWLTRVDACLALQSWDMTWEGMQDHMGGARNRRRIAAGPAVKTVESKPKQILLPAKSMTRSPARLTGVYDYLIVGAGFAGSVLAERLAREANKRVLVIDKRPHIGGNAYDEKNASDILIHKYGPHIFHTNSAEVFNYLSRFTKWRAYEHKVLAQVESQLLPVPINLNTVNRLYGLNLTSEELEDFFAARAETRHPIATSEDVVVSRIGRDLYEKFFRGYTRKQWGMDPSELDKSVIARVPTRTNCDDRYFTDQHQYMPLNGYTRMFEAMLDHPNIEIALASSFEDIREQVAYDHLIYTGPVDEFFDYRFGPLPYRSLRFEHVTRDYEWHQPVGVVNYPNSEAYTRVTEYKHLTGQNHPCTSLTYEYPAADGDPYYPIPCSANAALYKKYEALADGLPRVSFVGRLATYRYYNMDQVVAQALATFRKISDKSQVAVKNTAVINESRIE